MTTFNLKELFSQNWGITPSGKVTASDSDESENPQTADSLDKKISKTDIINSCAEEKEVSEFYKKDPNLAGRYLFMPLTLGSSGKSDSSKALFLPYCWIAVKSSKRIVETALTERRGTVREFIAMEDYSFSVKGFAIGQDGRFPKSQLENLRKLYERNEAIECNCALTDLFLLNVENCGQDKVVMYDLEISDNQGVEHVRGYSFELKSDQQFELEITD
jgi:hypothetical protein